MKKVAIGVALVATVAVVSAIVYEFDRVCCASPGVPLDQYWFDRIKAAHDHVAQPSEPRE